MSKFFFIFLISDFFQGIVSFFTWISFSFVTMHDHRPLHRAILLARSFVASAWSFFWLWSWLCSFSRSVHRCNYFRFLLGLTFVWFDHSLVRLGLFSRFRSLSRKLMRSFGRWQVISLFNVCVFNFLFFFPFPCNTGSTRESSSPSAGKSHHSCAIEHQIQQILRHLETTGIQNTTHCICQLETKMCT